jgi:hypothetical protein
LWQAREEKPEDTKHKNIYKKRKTETKEKGRKRAKNQTEGEKDETKN